MSANPDAQDEGMRISRHRLDSEVICRLDDLIFSNTFREFLAEKEDAGIRTQKGSSPTDDRAYF
jgi:hypothetical protein